MTRVVVQCGVSSPSSGFDRHDTNVHVRVDDAFTVTFEIVGNDRDVTTRRWRFILGTGLAMFAPRLADVAAAYYVSGAILGVAALALFFAAKAARIVPGGRAARTGAGIVAAVSAFVVPPEHVTKVLEMYVSLWLAPARLVVAAARRALFGGSSKFLDSDGVRTEYAGDPNVSDEGALEAVTLAYALAGTALTLAGAGAGLWATNAWVIDKSTGEVAAPAAAFARVAARALGATLLQFCTADAALGGALASIALVSAVAESAKSGSLARALSFFFTRKRRRVSRGDARRESDSDRSRRSDWSDSDDEDEEERARGGSRRIRRRVRAGAPAVGPLSFRGPRAVFAGADASARGLATPNRATRRTRHRPAGTGSAALLVRGAGGGGGAATAGTGPRPRWTPSRGPRPWCSSGRARARWARLPAGPPAPACGRGSTVSPCAAEAPPRFRLGFLAVRREPPPRAATPTPRTTRTATRCSERGTARRRRRRRARGARRGGRAEADM